MARPRGIQINQLVGQATWGSILVPSSYFPSDTDPATLNVSIPLSGKSSGGDDSTEGIYTTSPNNIVQIKGGNVTGGFYANYAPIVVEDSTDGNLHQVYAKMIFNTSNFILNFYYLDDGGTEKNVINSQLTDLNENTLLFRYCETVQFGQQKPTTIASNFETFDEVNVSSKQVDHEHGKEVFDLSGYSTGTTSITLNMSGSIANKNGTSNPQDFQVFWNGLKIEENKNLIGDITYSTGNPNTLKIDIGSSAPPWFKFINGDIITITYPYED